MLFIWNKNLIEITNKYYSKYSPETKNKYARKCKANQFSLVRIYTYFYAYTYVYIDPKATKNFINTTEEIQGIAH